VLIKSIPLPILNFETTGSIKPFPLSSKLGPPLSVNGIGEISYVFDFKKSSKFSI
jgi:hypothetical protein